MERIKALRNGFVAAPLRPCVRVPGRRFQKLKAGMKGEDTILDDPGTAFFTVRALQPNRVLVLYSEPHLGFLVPRYVRDYPRYGIYWKLTWALTLEEEVEVNNRLVLRTRAKYEPRPYQAITMPIFLVGGEIFTARKTLYGIKRRAERAGRELAVV